MKFHIGLRSQQRKVLPLSPDKIVELPNLRAALLVGALWVSELPLEDENLRNVVLTISRTDDE